jgi:hypothetical protein
MPDCLPAVLQIFGVNPDNLPPSLRAELLSALQGERAGGWVESHPHACHKPAILLSNARHHALCACLPANTVSAHAAAPAPASLSAVSPTVLEGAIRCGCTHLIVDVLLSREERKQLATVPRVVSAVQHLRRADSWRWREAPPAIVVSGWAGGGQAGPLGAGLASSTGLGRAAQGSLAAS